MTSKKYLIFFLLFFLCLFFIQPYHIVEAGHYNSTKQAYYYDDEEKYAFLPSISGTAQAYYVDVTSGTDGPYAYVACLVSPTRNGI
ncbi:hypothetical protein [Anaerovibrio lipolyticus]|uniref:hypothetical protein n=1 Tax=Anaerovibrio lipolyticus TaxID=82374 RepID=UPI0004811525|nr:hypothetical protein [Anaerovibrio lipolyticus]